MINKSPDEGNSRNLAGGSYFDNILINVAKQNYFGINNINFGTYYCRSTVILPFLGSDPD